MDQLVAQVSQRTGLSHEQAQQAVQAVLDVVKSRLPASMAGQVDALAGRAAAAARGGGLAQQAEGLLVGCSAAPAARRPTPPPPRPAARQNPSGTQTE